MEALLIYIGKSAIVLTLYALLFTTFLQNETFHRFKRFTLLSSILLAFALPLVNISVEFPLTGLFTKEVPTATEINVTTLHAIINDSTLPTTVPATTFWNYTTLLATLYLTGMLILVVRLIAMYITLAHIIKRGEMREGTPGIELRVIDEEIKPFSWFRWVVISNSDLQECGKEIIIHESAHCNALHSLDIMIAEIVIILQWFNPFAWFVKKQLKEIHEYEADQAVLHSGTNIKKYQQLIIKKAVGARLYSIANSFNHSSTIKRITMMCKKKSNRWRCTKALYILPATAFAALLFSQPESINATEHESNGKVTDFTVNKQETMFAIATGDSTAKKIAAIGEVKHAEPNDTVWDNEQVYQVVEKMPQFPGGNEAMFAFLQKNIRYPQEARDAKAKGRSVIQFIVNRNGNINNVHIVKSSGNEALDKEAVRVVESMPQWTPGKQNGKNVAVQYTLPIMFRLQGTPQPKRNDNMLLLNRESPLLIINGAIYEGNADIISNIKEEDIESVNVLEEGAATKLYGEKGKYGAIVLELKKHTQFDPTSFTYDNASSGKEPQTYQFNIGIKQGDATSVRFDTPGAEFIGDTSDLQLGNIKAVLDSGLTEGSVTIEFNVETDGSITFAKVTKSSGNNAVDSEALALIYNTQKKWKPATKDGKPVRSRPSLTLTFSKKR